MKRSTPARRQARRRARPKELWADLRSSMDWRQMGLQVTLALNLSSDETPGRRARVRRGAETRGAFVDIYRPTLLVVLMLVAVFNLVDAYCTLFFLSEGATEMNPVADYLLRQGSWVFVLGKSLGIGLCLGFLCLTKNFYMSRAGLTLVFGAYFLLTGYHIFLMATQLGPV